MTKQFAGVDVSRDALTVAPHLGGETRDFPNTKKGRADLSCYLRSRDVARVVLEASGGFERPVAQALQDVALSVAVVNPWLVESNLEWRERQRILRSAPGVGPVVATVLGCLLELGSWTSRRLRRWQG